MSYLDFILDDDNYINKVINNWINYSSSIYDFNSRNIFIYIQDVVIYNIDSGHNDLCIKMLNRLDKNDADVKEITRRYNANMGFMGASTRSS